MKKQTDRMLAAVGILLAVAALFIALFAPFYKVTAKIKDKESGAEYNRVYFLSWAHLLYGAYGDNASVTYTDGDSSSEIFLADDEILTDILLNREDISVVSLNNAHIMSASTEEIVAIVFIIFGVIVCGIMSILDRRKRSYIWNFGFGASVLCSGVLLMFATTLAKPNAIADYSSVTEFFEQTYTLSASWGFIVAAVCALTAGLVAAASGAIKNLCLKKRADKEGMN